MAFFRKFQKRLAADFNQVLLDKTQVATVCTRHTGSTVSLLSEALGVPVELLEVTSLRVEQRGSKVPIAYELGCDMCDAQEIYDEQSDPKSIKS